MTAQPQPVPVGLVGGIDTRSDETVAARPVRILNARYARGGALSKRYGFEEVSGPHVPQDPLPEEFDGYVAFDGDKFFARKNVNGVDFFQRRPPPLAGAPRDHWKVGNAGTRRPELTQLPAARGSNPRDLLLADIASSRLAFGSGSFMARTVVYARLEMTGYDALLNLQIFDLVVDYIDVQDSRLCVREPTRLRDAVVYAPNTRQQMRMIIVEDKLLFVYTTDRSVSPGRGLYYRALLPGDDPSTDAWSSEINILTPSSSPPLAMSGPVGSQLRQDLPAAFDCDVFLKTHFSVCYATPTGLGWARVIRNPGGSVTVTSYVILNPNFSGTPTSIAMTGHDNDPNAPTQREIVYSFVNVGVFAEGWTGKFFVGATGAPTGNSFLALIEQGPGDTVSGVVPAHSAVAGKFYHEATGVKTLTYLAGINSGDLGFTWNYGDYGAATLSGIKNYINCAWATGRPLSLYDTAGRWGRRVLMPMVSWGGTVGGGTGLFVDITPPYQYQDQEIKWGAQLMATYGVDQVALTPEQITYRVLVSTSPDTFATVWQSYVNARLALAPNVGSAIDQEPDRARWLTAIGHPATAVLLEMRENESDFEFIEPGVMIVGAGVPLMLDAINGLGELGFHTSPCLMHVGGSATTPAGEGWKKGETVQFRFQYRIIDGLGRAQVSPATDPIVMTAPLDDWVFGFKVAAYDVTLRNVRVLLDVYRTDANTNAFYLAATIAAEGGGRPVVYNDRGPKRSLLDRSTTINVEQYWMTPPSASHAFRGAFRDILVTRENEIWPSKRRLSTTAPQFDIVDSAAWDSYERVVTGGEIDGKVIFFSKSKIGFTYEMNGVLAPFTDIPADTGALEGSRAFSTHLGVFYQSDAGIRVVGRDMAIHETGLPVVRQIESMLLRGGIKVANQGEIRLRFEGNGKVNYFLVFDYFHGTPDEPCWYEYAYDDGGTYEGEEGEFIVYQIVDQVIGWDGRILYFCRAGYLLYETNPSSPVGARYHDKGVWVPMAVRSAPMRGRTPVAYLATIEGVVNLEKPALQIETAAVTLRLFGDYGESIPTPIFVEKAWLSAEGFDRRQLQITTDERSANAPAIALEYEDAAPLEGVGDGFGYRLSSMVMVYAERDPKTVFPVTDGARQ